MLRRAQAEISQAGWTREQRRAGRTGVEEPVGPALQEGIPITLRAVDLNDQQKERIRAIMQRYRPVAESIARSVRPRVQEIDFRMRQETMCVLTPKQRDDWIAWRRRERLSVEEGGAMLKLVTTNSCPADAGTP
jgi:Spy/CpxP family protein refolding chaperone